MSRFSVLAAAVSGTLLSTVAMSTQASVISFHVINGSPGLSVMASTDVAGATQAGKADARADHWNDATASGATYTWSSTVDNAGTAQSTTAAIQTFTGGAGGDPGGANSDELMMRSNVDFQGRTAIYPAGNPGGRFTASSIPYATYDVYVYISTWNSNVDRIAAASIGGTVFYGAPLPEGVVPTPTTGAGYINANSNPDGATLADYTRGNYLYFSNVSGSDLTIDLWGADQRLSGGAITGADGTTRFRLSGVQIVAVPEPASLAVLGLGSLVMLRRRRCA